MIEEFKVVLAREIQTDPDQVVYLFFSGGTSGNSDIYRHGPYDVLDVNLINEGFDAIAIQNGPALADEFSSDLLAGWVFVPKHATLHD